MRVFPLGACTIIEGAIVLQRTPRMAGVTVLDSCHRNPGHLAKIGAVAHRATSIRTTRPRADPFADPRR
jgi:hypothetical protein